MPGEEKPDRGVTEKCTKLLVEISLALPRKKRQ